MNVRRLLMTGAVLALLSQALPSLAVTPAMTIAEATELAYEMPVADIADESIYFVMTDRYANGNSYNDNNGFNDSNVGYFHGGDLRGLRQNLDRIEDMGFTAIWITPVVVQKAIQGGSAAYHGYWGLDFTTVDPHFGTEQDLIDLSDDLHSRGMKIYLDIVINHTADVISLNNYSTYRSVAGYPYKDAAGNSFTLSQVAGLPDCTEVGQTGCFPVLSLGSSFPQTVNDSSNNQKAPEFLADATNYHNRGNINAWSDYEQLRMGDFYGLDDVFTEKPAVIDGMADLWADWVVKYDIDGFRIDTARHVDQNFFNRWTPKLFEKVVENGGTPPQIYGEAFTTDRSLLSKMVRNEGLQSVLDFPIDDVLPQFAAGKSKAADLTTIWNWDDFYNRGYAPGLLAANAYSLVTFIGNHDEGRAALKIENANTQISESGMVARLKLAYAMLLLMRGAPTMYYGDEVGMVGVGGDKEARQDMFATFINSWRIQDRVGSAPIGADSSLDITSHPIMNYVKQVGALRAAHPALTDGIFQPRKATMVLPSSVGKKCAKKNQKVVVKSTGWTFVCKVQGKLLKWTTSDYDYVSAWSRFDRDTNVEYLVAANSTNFSRTVKVQTSTPAAKFSSLLGGGATATALSTGVVQVTVPARTTVVWKSDRAVPAPTSAPSISVSFKRVSADYGPGLVATVGATKNPLTVTFVARYSSSDEWFALGSDDSSSYRLSISNWMKQGHSSMQVAAIVRTTNGLVSVSPAIDVTF